MEKQRLTDASGDYVFGDLPVMVDYHITGKKRDDWMNGVSTLDLVMMQRHILGVAPFHNAYKMVAADVNNDSKGKCERHGGIEEADSGLDHRVAGQ